MKVTWGQEEQSSPIPGAQAEQGSHASGGDGKKEHERMSQLLQLPKGAAGKLIGPRGETARLVQEETGARIWVDRLASQARVTGSPQAVAAAERAIKALFPSGGVRLQVSSDEDTSISRTTSSQSSRSLSGCSTADSESQRTERPRGRQEHWCVKQRASWSG
uniref:K Homology domain-containing protein n=1 Tax=Alexandrium catenella TaxID=2925 RepID=A0A7S1LKD1_ALECA